MKYLRTETNIWEVVAENEKVYFVKAKTENKVYSKSKIQTIIIKQGNSIEDVCDEFIVAYKDGNKIVYQDLEWATTKASTSECKSIIYGAIWTNKGLIYVAKLNEKGVLELL